MHTDIHWALNLVAPPDAEVLTVPDAKAHLKVTNCDEEGLILALTIAAREHAEEITGRQLVTASWDYTLDRFPCSDVIDLPKSQLQSVTSIQYFDTANILQTVATTVYDVDATDMGRVYLLPDQSWPDTRAARSSVIIQFVAGYGEAADVPKTIVQAMKLMLSHWYENRTEAIAETLKEIPQAAQMLLNIYRRPGLE